MSFPKISSFGIIDNPLLDTPFSTNNDGDSDFGDNLFLLMDGEHFILMDGEQFELMGI